MPTTTVATLFSLWVAFLIGWIANIYQVFANIPATFGEMTPFYVIKAVCIFVAPIGSVLGWIGMF